MKITWDRKLGPRSTAPIPKLLAEQLNLAPGLKFRAEGIRRKGKVIIKLIISPNGNANSSKKT